MNQSTNYDPETEEHADYAYVAARNWVDLADAVDVETVELGIVLERLARAHERLLRRALEQFKPLGVRNMEDFRLLALLRRNVGEQLTVTQASKLLRLSPASTSTRVERLVDAGLIRRSGMPGDRRLAALTLEQGQDRLVDKIFRSVEAAHGEMFGCLEPADRTSLLEALSSLRRHHLPPLRKLNEVRSRRLDTTI